MPEGGIDETARRIVVDAAQSVRKPEFHNIRSMLIAAFRGDRP